MSIRPNYPAGVTPPGTTIVPYNSGNIDGTNNPLWQNDPGNPPTGGQEILTSGTQSSSTGDLQGPNSANSTVPTNGLDLPLRIVLNYTNVILKDTLQLTATLTDLQGTTQSATQNITWVSNSPSVASVDSNGLVTPHKYGTCIVEAQYPWAGGDLGEGGAGGSGIIYAQCQVTCGVEQILEQPALTVPPQYPTANISGKAARMTLSGTGVTHVAGNVYRAPQLSVTSGGNPVVITASLQDVLGNPVTAVQPIIVTSYNSEPTSFGYGTIESYPGNFSVGGVVTATAYSNSATISPNSEGEAVVEFQYPTFGNSAAPRTGSPSLQMSNDFISAQLIVSVVLESVD